MAFSKIQIRNELPSDYREVEELNRKAFWNLYGPGCDEHYLVHIMRKHEDFIPELDLVIECNNAIIANIMYTKSKIMDNNGNIKSILTFGPLSVLPEYQRNGYGKMLMEYSFKKAIELGYDTIAIFGNPENYISSGFKSSKHYNICVGDNIFPTALLIKELCAGAIPKGNWTFCQSNVYEVDNQAVEEFDKIFEPLVKEYKQVQELFYIYSHSRVF
ncbi:MAG: N-acetyltransferase [Lachnospiraceae bacterium]|nr:N-acetyltransferase [Lachnospiraceae bacterium]